MCVICGCSDHDATIEVPENGTLDFSHDPAGICQAGGSVERSIRIEADILGANNERAALNRAHFENHGILALNFVSSPGSGKTTLLCATIKALQERAPGLELGVIEGDQQTANDASRIRETGVEAVQINTGKGCHLDARMVGRAFGGLSMHDNAHARDDAHAKVSSQPQAQANASFQSFHPIGERAERIHAMLLIENVGNLVCPAMWDLGERTKVAVLSVTEGEDKPLKYPDMFAASQLMILNKIDLLPYVDFNVERCIEMARQVNPKIEVLQLSARTGEGMQEWIDWLLRDSESETTSNIAASQQDAH